MLTAAQAGPISLNSFLPGSDGPLAAWTPPEEVLLVMRKRLLIEKGEIRETAVFLFLVCACSWSKGMVGFQGLHGKSLSKVLLWGSESALGLCSRAPC